MRHTKTRTHSVTNTQLATAVLAAFLAGGLAFAAAPASQLAPVESPKCSVSEIRFSTVCAKNAYSKIIIKCSDEFTVNPMNQCLTSDQIQALATKICGARECALQK